MSTAALLILLSAMVPTWLSVMAFVCLVVAIELQVRFIDEPRLLATHGAAYRGYAAVTGRFPPEPGRLTFYEHTSVERRK